MSFEDNANFAEKSILGFRKTLVGNNLAENLGGWILVWLQVAQRFVKFAAKSSSGVILWGWREGANFI